MSWWSPDQQLHLLLLYVIMPCVIILLILTPTAFAKSPSFIRQEVKNPPHWSNMVYGNQTKNGPVYTNINSVTYSSDGKVLNSTLWLKDLSQLRKSHWKPSARYITYGVIIDSDLNSDTGYQGADYQLEISWNHTANRWTKTLIEYASNGQHRSIVHDTTDYTKFLENTNGNYIQLDLNLSKILSPPKYRVFFYAYSFDNLYNNYMQKIKSFQWLLDGIRWIYIPPPEFKMSISPSFIDLTSGQREPVELSVNNTTGFPSNVTLTTNHLPSDINATFENKTLDMPGFTVAKTSLNLDSMTNDGPVFHTIDINGAIRFPPQSFLIDKA